MDLLELTRKFTENQSDIMKKFDVSDEAIRLLQTETQSLFKKLDREGGSGGGDREKSIGEQFTDSEAFKSFDPRDKFSRASHSVKATITSATSGAGGVGDAIVADRRAGIMPLPHRRLTIRDLLTVSRTDSNTVEVVKVSGFTNAAAPVAENAAKPETDFAFDVQSLPVRTLAHWMKATTQALDDVSQLRSMVDNHLTYGLQEIEENQLLNGDNTGQNLNGIVTQATAFVAPVVPSDQNIADTIRLGMQQVSNAFFIPDAVCLHPNSWLEVLTLKNSDGDYIVANPTELTTPRLWGLPVVTTPAIAQGKFLTGAFKLGAELFDRWDIRIETGLDGSDFINNRVTIRAEERLALLVRYPAAFVYGNL